ncbi:MAG: hypothetical protein KBD52_01670 [Candidatus Pacebacteria bacterium]|nr:hypothetical protein [Candidatus Paceibacterota bacterium]
MSNTSEVLDLKLKPVLMDMDMSTLDLQEEGLDFISPDFEFLDSVVQEFKGKVLRITRMKGDVVVGTVVGTLHSRTLVFGEHINLVNIQTDKSSVELLKKYKYYHPKRYKRLLSKRNFRFASAVFQENPRTSDLLVFPVGGCTIECIE